MCPRKGQYWMRYRRAYNNKDEPSIARMTRNGESFMGTPIPQWTTDAEQWARMNMGTHLEDMVLTMMKARGFKLMHTGKEQETIKVGDICGHPDGLIDETPEDWPEDWDGWLLEVKTTQYGGYANVVGNSKREAKGPQEYYKDQATIYASYWDCPGVVFAYMWRDKGCVTLVPWKPEPGRLNKLMKKAAMILNFGKLPDKDPVGDWECKGCPFFGRCGDDG
jgi:hypothetical protein